MLLELLLVCGMSLGAEEPSDAQIERQRQTDLARLAPAKARQLSLWLNQPGEQADLHPQPLLRWSNPTAGSVYGEVYLWTHRKRPVAVASIFRWFDPYTDADIEFASLSDTAVGAQEKEAAVWTSKEPGVRWQQIAGSAPEASPSARLAQMRAIGKRFSARLLDQRGEEGVSRDLRLLQQPVYRYSDRENGVVDGALFAFVEVTDPEAWLLIEAREEKGKTQWRYAVARMNADALEMRMDDVRVAQWEKIHQAWKQREAPYTFFNFEPAQVRLPDDAPKP